MQNNFIRKAMRKQSTPAGGIPESGRWCEPRMPLGRKNPSEPKPKAQASRRGVRAARYSRRGLLEPAKKQIRWHHGSAAFVLK